MADRPGEPNFDHPTLTADLPSPTGDPAADEGGATDAPPLEPATVTVQLSWPELHSAVGSLWPQLAIPLVTAFGDTPEPPKSGRYTPPRGPELNIYLRLLEQLLAINCAITSRNAPFLVVGEAETLGNLFDLALRYPNSLPVRLMLGELLLRIRAVHPEILNQFAQPLSLLAERHPFPDPDANSLLQAQQAAAYSNGQGQAPQEA